MSQVYVYSTLSAPVRYSFYLQGGNDIPREERGILIRGGANVADKNFITPRGVQTMISAEEYALLKENKLFKTHVENGYITVEEKSVDIDKIDSDMETRDESSPLVPEDFIAEDKPAPVVNVPKQAGRPRGPNSKKPGGHPASKK